ncbi:MAG: YfiT family bacillithiol transferase [Cyclobacteriaceae bacterium]
MNEERLKYPIGKFTLPSSINEDNIKTWINDIESFLAKLQNAVSGLSDEQLDTPYRPEGWTIRQVVNHCADSHMNSQMRFKLALTEKKPVIKPYLEAKWAMLPDSISMPIEPALKMLEGIHMRWTVLLKSLTKDQLSLSYVHPEQGREIRLDATIALYAWHSNHHLAHIVNLKELKGW